METTSKPERSKLMPFVDSAALIPGRPGDHFISVLRHGTLNVKLSIPVVPARQTPHEQDEVYVIVRGRGIFSHDGKREPFKAGDLLFVAAGTEHQFEDCTEDLAVWVVFYGPKGGEEPHAVL
jgi:mannose-6-phosphate isomerase-like protein (cupin superfamily)